MPTYGYQCRSCEHTFDAFQSMSDEPLKTCPKCGREIRRLINGGTGIIFKGGGFYVTDKNGKGGRPGGKTTETKTAGMESAPCPSCPAAETSACPKAVNS